MVLGADTYGASLLDALGVDGAQASTGRYPELTLEELVALGPERVLLPTEPYPFAERHRTELARSLPGATVTIVDGQDLFWWGIRTPRALERVRAALA
jgi:ABC-type hemin transport system substrate-binding protein